MQFPAANAPTEQQKWVRAVEGAVSALERDVSNAKNRANNTSSSQTGTIGRLQAQVADLQAQSAELRRVTNYLAGLITISDTGNNWSSGDIPGDQTQRWTNGDGSTSVTLPVATGRASVRFGCGQITVHAGNSSMIAYLRVVATAPSGWTQTLGENTRLFVTSDSYFGIPVNAGVTFVGVPTDEQIKFELQFGTWSAATSPTSNALFATPSIEVEVTPS